MTSETTRIAGHTPDAAELMAIIADRFELDAILTPTSEFTDLGLDSLVLVELAVILKRRYGVTVDDDELIVAGTVERVVSLLDGKRVG